MPQELDKDADNEIARLGVSGPEKLRIDMAPQVMAAANAVRIAASEVERRRLEREAEEVEGWFRERARRETARETQERQLKETERAQHVRREWIAGWTRYALSAIPYGLPREAELDVHASVSDVLGRLDLAEHETTIKRLIGAATEKALVPWRRAQDRQKAIESATNRLPIEVRYLPDFGALKSAAAQAVAAAVAKCGEDVSFTDLELAATNAVQPMIREYDHRSACSRAVAQLYLPNATSEEIEQGRKLVKHALAALAVGGDQEQIERAKRDVLASLETKITRRKEAQRIEEEERHARQEAECKADARLWQIEVYLREQYEFDGGLLAMRQETDRLKPIIRKS